MAAHNDSGATHDVAKWQELCDTLAKEALSESRAWSVPFLDLVVAMAFILREGRLVLDANKSLDKAVIRFQGFQLPDTMLRVGRAWQETVLSRGLSHEALAFAFRMRTTPWCHTSSNPDFSCPICR